MKTTTLSEVQGLAVLAGLALAGFIGWKLYKGGADLTKTATDSAGRPVTAYQAAGPIGVLAAAANKASGGYLATFGDWLGGAVYDLANPTPAPTPTPSVAGSQAQDEASAAATAKWMYPAGTFSEGAGYGTEDPNYFMPLLSNPRKPNP